MDQTKTPLFSALKGHIRKDPISFHVPGHKSGTVFPYEGLESYQSILKLDQTEISGLDDLHDPEGVIKEARELLSGLYGTKSSFFLVNGSTAGNLAMILSVCGLNDIVLVQRNSHKSIVNALELSGAVPVFLALEYDETVKVAGGVKLSTVQKALKIYPQAKAVILTSPNYYGMTGQLEEIINEVHSYDIPVLVDEAHGPHFILGRPFPASAVSLGADAVVHSAHKMLPAMTMGSFLHINGSRMDLERLKHYLQVLQSSSPSYPIMASLDLARCYLAGLLDKGINGLYKDIESFKNALSEIDAVKAVESEAEGIKTDPLKLTLQTRSALSGFELQKKLENEGVFTELADPQNVLLVLPLSPGYDFKRAAESIQNAFAGLERTEERKGPIIFGQEEISKMAVCYKDLKGYNKEVVSLSDSVGSISAQMVVPYPPGIPILMPGEIINRDHIEGIKQLQELGARFQGAPSIKEQRLQIFK